MNSVFKSIVLVISFAFSIVLCAQEKQEAKDEQGFSQGFKQILLDDDKVQVVKLVYPAKSESGLHSHQFPSRVVYVVRGGTIELVAVNGEKRTLTLKSGQVMRVPAATHNIRNIGDTEVELIETELK